MATWPESTAHSRQATNAHPSIFFVSLPMHGPRPTHCWASLPVWSCFAWAADCVSWRAWPSFTAGGLAALSPDCQTARLPEQRGFGAITLGHMVVGIDQAMLCVLRAHEHAHVRQYKQWGLFFLPAYALSSLWQVVNGRSAHASNFFERQACAAVQARQKGAAAFGRFG